MRSLLATGAGGRVPTTPKLPDAVTVTWRLCPHDIACDASPSRDLPPSCFLSSRRPSGWRPPLARRRLPQVGCPLTAYLPPVQPGNDTITRSAACATPDRGSGARDLRTPAPPAAVAH